MQEIITWIVIAGALILLTINVTRVIRLFRKPDPCKGCGDICDNCPVYANKK